MTSLPNRNCRWKTSEEEQSARQAIVEGMLKVLRGLLADLAKIDEPRNPKKIKHKLTVKGPDEEPQYYVYLLEAKLVFHKPF